MLKMLAVLTASASASPARPLPTRAEDQYNNVLFIVVDNLRPALGAYGVPQAVTPAIDRLAEASTLFSRAFCQESWCSPSRNSFLTGRRPRVTRVWNFRDDFRVNQDGTPGAGADWITLPQYFKQHGYYTTSSGKVFHPSKPANFDFPKSWSDQPTCENKSECATPDAAWPATMTCALNTTTGTADYKTATATIDRLTKWSTNAAMKGVPFFAAAGFQGPRLAWSYPTSVLARLPAVEDMRIAKHPASNSGEMDWFRPTEVAWYGDVQADGGITHARPLSDHFQRQVRLAYYATVTHVDDQVDRLLGTLRTLGVDDSTVVVLTADHAQNLGEGNMWSMMSLREQALRVPLMIRDAPRAQQRRHFVRTYGHPVELVDVYPTVVSLAGLVAPPTGFGLAGTDLVPGMLGGAAVKPVNAAFGEITRCKNCSEAYATDPQTYERGCSADSADATEFLVPCALTARHRFDYMGMTVRQLDWRFTVFCGWDGGALAPDFGHCLSRELYSHANDTAIYDVDANGEQINLAGDPQHADTEAALFKLITTMYGSKI